MDWVKRRVEVQGQMFWVVRFQVRNGVSFLVKEWGWVKKEG